MDEIERLIGLLKDTDPNISSDAANQLVMIGTSAVHALIEAVKDGDEDVRWGAAWALRGIKAVRAVPTLIEALKDGNEEVRRSAAEALVRVLDNCRTIESLEAFEKGIEEGFPKLQGRYDKYENYDARLKVAALKGEAAKRRNALTPDKGIVLDDIPKPPEKGKMYRMMRGTVRNG